MGRATLFPLPTPPSHSNNHNTSSPPWPLFPLTLREQSSVFSLEVSNNPSPSMRGLQFLTCHMLDSMCNFLIRGGGDGTQHLLQVWHPQMGMCPFPPAHGRLLAHFLFGGLSVDLSQVRALGFGQFTLCRDSTGKHLIEAALALQRCRLKPSNGTQLLGQRSWQSLRGPCQKTCYTSPTQTLTPNCLRSCQRAGFDDLINSSKCYQCCGNNFVWPLLQATLRSDPQQAGSRYFAGMLPACREACINYGRCRCLWVITAAPVIATLTQMTEIIF